MYDLIVQSWTYRGIVAITGTFGLVFVAWAALTFIRRGVPPSDVRVLADGRYHGDVAKAQAMSRIRFQQLLMFAITCFAMLLWAVFAPYSRELHGPFLLLYLGIIALVGVWSWTEYEWAWPGLFIPRGLRGTPGMRTARQGRAR